MTWISTERPYNSFFLHCRKNKIDDESYGKPKGSIFNLHYNIFLFLHYSLNVNGKMLNVNSVIEFSNNVYLTSYKSTFVRVNVFRLIVD